MGGQCNHCLTLRKRAPRGRVLRGRLARLAGALRQVLPPRLPGSRDASVDRQQCVGRRSMPLPRPLPLAAIRSAYACAFTKRTNNGMYQARRLRAGIITSSAIFVHVLAYTTARNVLLTLGALRRQTAALRGTTATMVNQIAHIAIIGNLENNRLFLLTRAASRRHTSLVLDDVACQKTERVPRYERGENYLSSRLSSGLRDLARTAYNMTTLGTTTQARTRARSCARDMR